MVKVSVNRYVEKRIQTAKNDFEKGMEKIRNKTVKKLGEVFKTAEKIAKGEIRSQRIDGKMVKITIPQRKKWLK